MTRASFGQEPLQGHLFWLIFALGEFFKHHLALHGEGLRFKAGAQNQIKQQIQGFCRCVGRNQNVEMDIIEAGGSIGHSP